MFLCSCDKDNVSLQHKTQTTTTISIEQAIKSLDATLRLIDVDTKSEPNRTIANIEVIGSNDLLNFLRLAMRHSPNCNVMFN